MSHIESTITKDELLELLKDLPGDTKIYVRTNRRSAKAAIENGEKIGTTTLSLRLNGVTETTENGIGLVADLP